MSGGGALLGGRPSIGSHQARFHMRARALSGAGGGAAPRQKPSTAITRSGGGRWRTGAGARNQRRKAGPGALARGQRRSARAELKPQVALDARVTPRRGDASLTWLVHFV